MGILEDLKKEADNSRLEREQAELRQQDLERIYREGICPSMMRIHNYLFELVEQLGLVNWPVEVSFDFPGIGRIDNLAQTNYRLRIDSHKEPKLINLSFECAAPEEKSYSVMPKSVGDDACQFLSTQKVMFSDWAIKDANQEIIGIVIKCKLRVWVGLAFQADIANEGIRVVSYNFEGRGESSFLASHQSIDEQWLDRLGQYVLRKNDSFARLDISDDQLNKLRSMLEREKQRMEHLSIENRHGSNTRDGLLLRLGKLFKRE